MTQLTEALLQLLNGFWLLSSIIWTMITLNSCVKVNMSCCFYLFIYLIFLLKIFNHMQPYGFDVGQSEKGNVLKGLDLGVQGMRVGGQV